MSQGGPTRVFISYSHDSPEHMKRVLALANRLRSEGVDSIVDQYVMSPHEGWPRWMMSQITEADFVIVVCTVVYQERIMGKSAPGTGLGAKWEGSIITQEHYEDVQRGDKFIPVVFGAADQQHIPVFLRGATRYNVSSEEEYDLLYRRLTSQPRVVMPELGEVRVLDMAAGSEEPPANKEAASPSGPLALLYSPEGRVSVIPERSSQVRDEEVVLLLRPNSGEQRAFLSSLRAVQEPIGLAFGDTAILGRIRSIQEERENGADQCRLVVRAEDTDYGAGWMEMSTSEHTADDFAEMRARRILLDERHDVLLCDEVKQFNNAFDEVLIRGQNTPIQVEESPLPDLYRRFAGKNQEFLVVARLFSILILRLSGVVEHVVQLDLGLQDEGQLSVTFEGMRARKYANTVPARIRVSGVCDLNRGAD